MIKQAKLVVLASVLVSGNVLAASVVDSGVSAFIGSASIESEDSSAASFKPSGYDLGVRVLGGLRNGVFGSLEYTRFNGDDSNGGVKLDLTSDEIRGTVGYAMPVAANARFYGEAGYESLHQEVRFPGTGLSNSDTAKGPYLGIGGDVDVAPQANLYGRIGYLSLKPDGGDSASGPDLLAGAAFRLSRSAAVFGEFRYADLSQDGSSVTFQSFRGGVKLSFR